MQGARDTYLAKPRVLQRAMLLAVVLDRAPDFIGDASPDVVKPGHDTRHSSAWGENLNFGSAETSFSRRYCIPS